MQKIFITGASSGIGHALAHEYAKRLDNKRCVLGLVARRSEHLQDLADALQNQYKINCCIFVSKAIHFLNHNIIPTYLLKMIHHKSPLLFTNRGGAKVLLLSSTWEEEEFFYYDFFENKIKSFAIDFS